MDLVDWAAAGALAVGAVGGFLIVTEEPSAQGLTPRQKTGGRLVLASIVALAVCQVKATFTGGEQGTWG
jgi:hypothetical protein